MYKIPLDCGKVHIGQTGPCVNDRLREHALSIKNGTGLHLRYHCNVRTCEPLLENTCILWKSKHAVAQELAEAMYMRKFGDQYISVPSSLYENEFTFLADRM